MLYPSRQLHRFVSVIAVALAGLFVSCGGSSSGSNGTEAERNTAQFLQEEGFNEFTEALQRAGLLDSLTDGAFTVFAPTDEAFDRLPEGLIDGLSIERLTDVLLYHISTSVMSTESLEGMLHSEMANGDDIVVDVVSADLFVNDARVTAGDIATTTGVVHVIDRVLLPPQHLAQALAMRGEFSRLLQLMTTTGSLEPNAPGMTLLAPTDAAFERLPAGMLEGLTVQDLTLLARYHCLPSSIVATDAVKRELIATLGRGSVLFSDLHVNGIELSSINIPTRDGILFVIGTVLDPPGTLFDTIAARRDLETLNAILLATNLSFRFDNPNKPPATVFAPSDDAFAALPAGTLDALLAEPGHGTLLQILDNHVVAGNHTEHDVAAASTTGLPTGYGGTLAITIEQGEVFVDGARLVAPNLLATNGIVHVIDAVLVPDGLVLP